MAPKSLEIDELKIFTLNCWGLRYISDHRLTRIKLIAQHLVDQDYDVVFLQEVWVQSDFEYIRTKTSFKYRFAHMFNNASLLGTSGLVILAKWTPKLIHFHPFSINGSPFRPLHGDWYSTKGVAYVRIELRGLNLHLFCTHMHAQYDLKEHVIDQYSIHRICQAYELAKFINLMTCNCTNTTSKDLIIMAGDMNTSSKELPYRLLTELTDLNDCYKLIQQNFHLSNFRNKTKEQNKQQVKRINKIQNDKSSENCGNPSQLLDELNDEDSSSDEELTTCGHRDNTFTPQQDLKADKIGKRIDFIFYKLRDPCSRQSILTTNKSVNEAINLLAKNNSPNESIESGDMSIQQSSLLFCIPERVSVVAKDVSGLSFSDHQPVVAKLHFLWKSLQDIHCNADCDQETNHDQASTNNCSSINDILLMSSLKLIQHKVNKRKQLSNNKLAATERAMQILPTTPLYKRWKDSPLVQEIEQLLREYIEKFKPSAKYSFIFICSMILMFLLMLVMLSYFTNLSYTELFLMTIIFFMVSGIGIVLKFITNRTEINAIKAILNDIRKKKTFHPDYYGSTIATNNSTTAAMVISNNDFVASD